MFFAFPEDITQDELVIKGQEAVHITRVLRSEEGDNMYATDGNGNRYRCKISHIKKHELRAEILQQEYEKKPLPLVTLCVGILKKRDRLEMAIEKSVELGVDEIIVFRGMHSQKEHIRMERVQAVALSAMKQSLRSWLPKIAIEDSLERALNHSLESSMLIIADETKKDFTNRRKQSDHYFLVVGPEGGFSEEERKLLLKHNAIPYSLGNKRLRSETASIILTSRFKSLSQ